MGIHIYLKGALACSVCAPLSASPEDVVAAVNAQHPAGTEHGWQLDPAPTFASGGPNPGPCERDPTRRHYLFLV